jgi:hypothetical protein
MAFRRNNIDFGRPSVLPPLSIAFIELKRYSVANLHAIFVVVACDPQSNTFIPPPPVS